MLPQVLTVLMIEWKIKIIYIPQYDIFCDLLLNRPTAT